MCSPVDAVALDIARAVHGGCCSARAVRRVLVSTLDVAQGTTVTFNYAFKSPVLSEHRVTHPAIRACSQYAGRRNHPRAVSLQSRESKANAVRT
jgi:hypothetical protein